MTRPDIPAAVREALPRTSEGLQSFASIARGLRWAKWKPFDPNRGTLLDKQNTEVFIDVKQHHDCTVSGIKFNPARALVGVPQFIAPGAERLQAGRLSLRVIPWAGGWSLVTMSDKEYVGSSWLGFVPTAEVVAAVEGAL